MFILVLHGPLEQAPSIIGISYHFEVEGIVCHIGAVEINEFCSGVKEEVCGFTVDFGFQVYVVTEVFYVVFPAVGVQGCEEER